ncbi:MAG: hypothetical protein MUF61_01855 [archaeon]|jgi:hypothetical protein|nr:hypothetical protein [archaeon]
MLNKARLPKKWDKDLAYLFGLLLGDGSLPLTQTKRKNGDIQKRYFVYFISNSREFLDKFYIPLFEKLFELTPRIEVKKRKNILYNCRIHSKQIYNFLVDFGYPAGRKAKIAKVPKELPEKYEIDLLAGLLDTDGGKKGGGFGLSTSSKYLADFCIKIFEKLEIPYHSCPWRFKEHIYHQIYVNKPQMHKILKTIPIRNIDKINFIQSYMPQ